MGVHGLWKLIEPSGKPIPLDSLENKVLAVDLSIWLHQAIKGFQDARGASIPNAHLLGIYHRLCKLLYYRIKPVFVFDGGVPALKHETINKRNQMKSRNLNEADNVQQKLLKVLMKNAAIGTVLNENLPIPTTVVSRPGKSHDESLFMLPDSQENKDEEMEESNSSDESPTKLWNIHNIDEKSKEFRALPADVRHEILTDLKETRKQNSWGRIHELPKKSNDFALYQMNRLLKRYSIQTSIEEAEKEMGGASLSIAQLENLLHEQGVNVQNWSDVGKQIVSNENTRYLYIKDVKKALEKARLKQAEEESLKSEEAVLTNNESTLDKALEQKNELESKNSEVSNVESTIDKELEDDLRAAIELSLQCEKYHSPKIESTSKKNLESDLEAAIEVSFQNEASTSRKSTPTVLTSNKLCTDPKTSVIKETHEDEDLQRAIALSLADQPQESYSSSQNSSNQSSNLYPLSQEATSASKDAARLHLSTLQDSDFSTTDDEIKEVNSNEVFSAARNYMLEYGGLTRAGVENVLGISSNKEVKTSKKLVAKSSEDEEESSSDDFVEVSTLSNENDEKTDTFFAETKNLNTNASSNTEKSSSVMEICIKADSEALEDDLFSDIFTKSNTSEIHSETPNKHEHQTETTKDQSEITANFAKNPNLEISSQNATPETPKNQTKETAIKKMSKDDLKALNEILNQQTNELLSERSTKERLAVNISDQMYQDVQELLQLFGIPYILAPMEAEAQCAFLEQIELTHGTITDDSDIWLFGGKTVYKNFFNQDKQVLEYRAENIRKYFNLSRHELIALAMLVGSDYTTGVPGIGPVTALEVLAAFPTKPIKDNTSLAQPPTFYEELLSGLRDFRRWIKDGMVPGPKRKTALRAKLKNVHLHEGFPNVAIVRAYMDPTLETDKGGFTWGKPNRAILIEYAREKFGWTEKKSSELLDPVIGRLNDSRKQKKIQDYFKLSHKQINSTPVIEGKMSKRVKMAVQRLGKRISDKNNEDSSDDGINLENGVEDEVVKKVRKLSKKKVKTLEEEINKAVAKPQLRRKRRIESKETQENAKVPKINVKQVPVVFTKDEVIPQRQKDKEQLLNSKLKAIEVFRKSKRGPGYVKHKSKVVRKPKQDAELSESSSD